MRSSSPPAEPPLSPQHVDMALFDLLALEGRVSRYEADSFLPRFRVTRRLIEDIAAAPDPPPRPKPVRMKVNRYVWGGDGGCGVIGVDVGSLGWS